jgi:hypothetical protein
MVKASAVVVLLVLAGHPLAAMACEARCDRHGTAKAHAGGERGIATDAPASAGAHQHLHLAPAVPEAAAVVTSAVPASRSTPILNAVPSLCCQVAVAPPTERFALTSRSSARSNDAGALVPVSALMVIAATDASAAGERRPVPALLHRPLSVLRL